MHRHPKPLIIMLDRLFTCLLLLAALGWSIASFAAALHLLPATEAAPVRHVELQKVVIVAHRAPATIPLARNDDFSPAAPAVR